MLAVKSENYFFALSRLQVDTFKTGKILFVGGDTAKNGADCYSKNGDAVTVPTWQS